MKISSDLLQTLYTSQFADTEYEFESDIYKDFISKH